ncbi:hypothetical protein GCM10027428_03850 [Haliea atlantica]
MNACIVHGPDASEHTEDDLRRRPDLSDLYRLAAQVERDRDLPLAELQSRDRQVGAGLAPAAAAGGRLDLVLGWLEAVAPPAEERGFWRPALAAQLAGLLAFALGFSALAGLLLGSERALVNVLVFLALFVVLQWLLMLGNVVVLWRLWRGGVPQVLPVHPGRWLVARSPPDARDLREAQPLLRLLFLRHGQALGALFLLGAALAFLLLPLLADYSFVWGSTYALGESTLQTVVDALASPWQSVLPAATISPELLASSRYHAAASRLDAEQIASMRGWWGFLMLCLLSYALLPRLLLWELSRRWYRRQLDRAVLAYPGVERLLSRLQAPLVTTLGEAAGAASEPSRASGEAAPDDPPAVTEPDSLLVELAGALGPAGTAGFEELSDWRPLHRLALGTGDLEQDRQQLASLPVEEIRHLHLVVKGWEPPVAELADLLEVLGPVPRCSVYLAPLPGQAIPHRKVEDWRLFARGLPFHAVDLQLLSPVVSA